MNIVTDITKKQKEPIPEDDSIKPKPTMFKRSWTIQLFKSTYAPIILSIIGVSLALSCFYISGKAEARFVKEIVVDTSPINFTHTVKAAEVDTSTMTTEEYITFKFGKDAKMALAISQAENGTRQCDRFGVNANKTIDVGVFQLNTVHLKKGWKLEDLIDCHKNVDYAFEIYEAQGWTPWVTYQTKAYKKFLSK